MDAAIWPAMVATAPKLDRRRALTKGERAGAATYDVRRVPAAEFAAVVRAAHAHSPGAPKRRSAREVGATLRCSIVAGRYVRGRRAVQCGTASRGMRRLRLA